MTNLINRQDAIDAVYERIKQIGHENDPLVLSIMQAVREVPSVVPVKHGRWIEYDTDDQYDEIQCPHCKHLYVVDAYRFADIGITKDDLRYCPNCGADMRGENEHND